MYPRRIFINLKLLCETKTRSSNANHLERAQGAFMCYPVGFTVCWEGNMATKTHSRIPCYPARALVTPTSWTPGFSNWAIDSIISKFNFWFPTSFLKRADRKVLKFSAWFSTEILKKSPWILARSQIVFSLFLKKSLVVVYQVCDYIRSFNGPRSYSGAISRLDCLIFFITDVIHTFSTHFFYGRFQDCCFFHPLGRTEFTVPRRSF